VTPISEGISISPNYTSDYVQYSHFENKFKKEQMKMHIALEQRGPLPKEQLKTIMKD
jgi:hypothetical protein